MYGYRGRIGLLVPNMNTTMEMDFHRLAPEGVSVHTARISWKTPENSVRALTEVRTNSVRAAIDVAAANVDVIVYGCTGASVLGGAAGERDIVEMITAGTNIPTITTATAMLGGLRELGIGKVSLASPFSPEVDAKLAEFLEVNDIRVVKLESLNQRDVQKYEKYSHDDLCDLVKKAATPDSDGVFVPCNQLRAIELPNALETFLEKPVVTSVQASLWLALKTIGVKTSVEGYGSLLTRL